MKNGLRRWNSWFLFLVISAGNAADTVALLAWKPAGNVADTVADCLCLLGWMGCYWGMDGGYLGMDGLLLGDD